MSLGTAVPISKVVRVPVKRHCTAGRFDGSSVSRNQPCKWPWTSTVTLKEIQWWKCPNQMLTMIVFLWVVGGAKIRKIGDQSGDPQISTEQANIWWPKLCFVRGSDLQRSSQQATGNIWQLGLACKHMIWWWIFFCSCSWGVTSIDQFRTYLKTYLVKLAYAV